MPRTVDSQAVLAGDETRLDTRMALVLAAVDAFSRVGYDGVTIREIERRAGVSRGLAAHHFGTKDALWESALAWLMSQFEDEWRRFRDFLPMLSADERRRVLIRIYIRFVAAHPEFLRLLVAEGNERSARAKTLVDQYLRRQVDFFHRVTGERQPGAEQAAIDHFIFTGAASMIFAAPAQCQLLFGVDPTTNEFIERFADVIAERGLHRGPARGSPADDSGYQDTR